MPFSVPINIPWNKLMAKNLMAYFKTAIKIPSKVYPFMAITFLMAILMAMKWPINGYLVSG